MLNVWQPCRFKKDSRLQHNVVVKVILLHLFHSPFKEPWACPAVCLFVFLLLL